MNRRSFLYLVSVALGFDSIPSNADTGISLDSARKDDSLRQLYLAQVGVSKGIQKIVYDHYYGESSCDVVNLLGSYHGMDSEDKKAELMSRKDLYSGQPIFTILDKSLFGLGNPVAGIYVAPPFFDAGYRSFGGSMAVPVDSVDETDRLQSYRYASGRDVAYALEHQDKLRSIQAKGYPDYGFGYGSLSGLSRYDSSVVFRIVRLDAHMSSFPDHWKSINRFLALDTLKEMCALSSSLDRTRPRSSAVRDLLLKKIKQIQYLVEFASDSVRDQIGR